MPTEPSNADLASTGPQEIRPTAAEPQTSAGPRLPTPTGLPRSPLPEPLTPSAPAAGPATFGKYELLAEIAHGGMGVVYKARDTLLDRIVALKVLQSGARAERDEVVRFLREAKAAAQLTHPHIVPIHEVGEHAGQHYFTMTLAAGGSLDQHLARYGADPRAAVALVEKVARTVHCLHLRGILHRDLKPANILLDEQGEPLVSDFGLAKFLDASVELTQAGERLGTPAYMAPEQVTGSRDALGPRTDVWALGVILYQLLTGRRPFGAKERSDLSQQILARDPPSLRSVRPELDPRLEPIVLKCLEKEPARRYASAEALADDLARWLRNEPTAARPHGWLRWARRRVSRHPLAATVLGLLVLLGGTLAVVLPPYLESERPWATIYRRLANGEPVTLIGETGPPAYSRWVLAEGGPVQWAGEPGRFSISSHELALLELLPALPEGRYRFSAWVRHDAGEDGQVGLYFGHRRHDTAAGPQHGLIEYTYTDRRTDARRARDDQDRPTSRARVSLRSYCQPVPDVGWNRSAGTGLKTSFQSGPPQGPSPWRQLAVTITPAAITASWEGVSLGKLPRPRLETLARSLSAGVPQIEVGAADFDGWGGLGLYVSRSTASFRQVALEPLADGP